LSIFSLDRRRTPSPSGCWKDCYPLSSLSPAGLTLILLGDVLTPEVREALEYQRALMYTHHVSPTPEERRASGLSSNVRWFQAGRLGRYFDGPWTPIDLRRTVTAFEWDVAPLPRYKRKVTRLTADAWTIQSGPKRQREAWQFVSYLSSKEVHEQTGGLGTTVPPRRSVAESPRFLDPSTRRSQSVSSSTRSRTTGPGPRFLTGPRLRQRSLAA